MTRLYNLESYSELCTYTNLYEKKIESSLSKYKNFLDKYQNQGYCINSFYTEKLSLQDNSISIQYPGIELSQENNNLYIIPDRINSLDLSNILKPGEDYIYKSVYHYWNYYNQIADNLDLSKPTVIIDLNSLSNESYCCLEFKQHEKTLYHIPIIDNRNEADSNFKIALDFKGIHDNIYQALAQYIISSKFPQLAQDENTIKHLKSYLQKIQIFKIAQCQTDSDNFSIIVEISYQKKVYYKSVTLEISLLEDIVTNKIEIEQIATFTNQHPDYSCVLISDYNFLPKFREALNNNNIFLADNRLTEFPQLWLEKQQQNFPLFGQYLDKIKFKIKQDGKEKWIQVLSQSQDRIYYENESGKKEFIARIQETGQEYFQLSYPYNVLPIKINEQDYCLNNKIQEYKIIHPCSEAKAKSEELIVRIEFIVKLGSVPQLRVIDAENKYKIEAKLCDRQEIVQLLGYIPLNTILDNRRNKNSFVPSSEKLQNFIDALSPIRNIDNFDTAMRFSRNIWLAYEIIRRNNNNPDLFLNLDYNHSSVENVKETISNLNNSGIINELRKYVKGNYNFQRNKGRERKEFIEKLIIFFGKTYQLSEYLNLNQFFVPMMIESACKNKSIRKEYFLFLSRVALTLELQLNYFKVFSKGWINNQRLYQHEQYLWGYSRILLWYFEFNNQDNINYLEHFTSIINYLLTGQNLAPGYKQNAFLALIYLLTFRDPSLNQKFCEPKSEAYKLAELVVEKYKDAPVKLRVIGDKPLNEYFEELLEYKSSQKAIRDLVEVANKS